MPILFADDASVLISHSNPVKFKNTIKTCYINFTAKNKVERDIRDLGTIITTTNYTRILDLTIEYSITWERHIHEIIKKLYDKKYKTSCVYEYITKHLLFIFPFCHDIWIDVSG
jgi:outer membrane cobalamin receptor